MGKRRLGKTEKRILVILKYSPGLNEEEIRKRLKRKSPIYKELDWLWEKNLITYRMGSKPRVYHLTHWGENSASGYEGY